MELQSLLTEIENKKIVVPEFQREYVWDRNQAKSLLHSLYYEYPVGGLLFWKVNMRARLLDQLRLLRTAGH